ncbi:DUF2179 domain-containing protein [Halalkalibacterium halodurans]|jgi:uncharacterized protein YebE (UPF0316 family)|uniref:UPF0316 protein BH0621 n=2 Tax=Halalkalibacterium halodurans TaxID=86665 RepID=Y621_HALH5|nr:DUF2179 domain-containing protein [Halalkalibacterium halodurans]Q9KF65.1 RecName: Full=UPF0316 protein BH0621 [Halalkalibacterium halodurans C-125]MDY7221115.1 DUF2179 domain-containing protein [Halalkalibacterium halodurans]MDY7240354.1 DUF2179 domain-containing protein [Halalkalibacterium halodurans]MED3647591.1 DUF2179 domain-containing protein [Halalkalibacterium halodurans]MED4082750.1 DUF2179 domain-containing protein [Halalkalibacterium halodurans]MED4086676.1 DUF2179 domain-contai
MVSFFMEHALTMILIILIINVVYVTLFTVRMIFTLKNQRYLAATVSMIEIIVYVLGLSLVLDNLDRIENLIAYAVGYGIGVITGMKVEEKLALGYITVNVITKEYEPDIPNTLRDKGYGVTNWVAYGREGERLMMEILTSRKSEADLYATIKKLDPKAFIISHEPKTFFGGFWVKGIRR